MAMATNRRRRPSGSHHRPTPGKKRHVYEFKPDPKVNNFFKKLYLTQVQRMHLLKWGLYALVCLTLLVLQDSMLAQLRLLGNEGPTIPPEELSLLFERFHKIDKSRTHKKDGWGLGLYIVNTIIGLHGEDISVTSQDGLTEFTFTLPLVE